MLSLNNLKKIVSKKKKRLGRGLSSRKGAKSGRGTTRHQTAREKVPLHFEGGQNRMVKKFPLLRGKGKNKGKLVKPVSFRVSALNVFSDNEKITLAKLVKKGLLTKQTAKDRPLVKIVYGGELKVKGLRFAKNFRFTPKASRVLLENKADLNS
ncbi:MAG: hypothetical protein KatS3mg090_0295 [Patescibacteria group bacterium]|nr:MAG: hypothetical protein KatS3mg090_0295 [Patescibacteria group bacterium]